MTTEEIPKRLRKLLIVVDKLQKEGKPITVKAITDRLNFPRELAFRAIAEAHFLHLMEVPPLKDFHTFDPYMLSQAILHVKAEWYIDSSIELGLVEEKDGVMSVTPEGKELLEATEE